MVERRFKRGDIYIYTHTYKYTYMCICMGVYIIMSDSYSCMAEINTTW